MYHSLFTHSSVNGHLGCFHVLAFVNNAAVLRFHLYFIDSTIPWSWRLFLSLILLDKQDGRIRPPAVNKKEFIRWKIHFGQKHVELGLPEIPTFDLRTAKEDLVNLLTTSYKAQHV